jgi:hypothetical protein
MSIVIICKMPETVKATIDFSLINNLVKLRVNHGPNR